MKFKFELNRAGVRELLQSEEMSKVIREYTSQVEANAGGSSAGYESNVQTHNRVVGRVYASTESGQKKNESDNTLLKALHG